MIKLMLVYIACFLISLSSAMIMGKVALWIYQRRIYRAAVKRRLCAVCKKRDTDQCPIRGCADTMDKPHWEEE